MFGLVGSRWSADRICATVGCASFPLALRAFCGGSGPLAHAQTAKRTGITHTEARQNRLFMALSLRLDKYIHVCSHWTAKYAMPSPDPRISQQAPFSPLCQYMSQPN